MEAVLFRFMGLGIDRLDSCARAYAPPLPRVSATGFSFEREWRGLLGVDHD
jgi:hypothetical protein